MASFLYNRFKDTTIYGTLKNSDNPLGISNANVVFDRNLSVAGDISGGSLHVAGNDVASQILTLQNNSAIGVSGGAFTIIAEKLNNFSSGLIFSFGGGIASNNAVSLPACSLNSVYLTCSTPPTSPVVINVTKNGVNQLPTIILTTSQTSNSLNLSTPINFVLGDLFQLNCISGAGGGAIRINMIFYTSGVVGAIGATGATGSAGINLLPTANTWTGTNAFNTSLPTSTITPSSGTELTTKTYVDSLIPTSIFGLTNTWTGLNKYDSLLPTSTLNPALDEEFTTVKWVNSAVATRALKDSPSLTGIPLAPTAPVNTNTTQIATTAFVTTALTPYTTTTAMNTKFNLYALLTSPTFTGIPLAPTAVSTTNTTQIATTAFVKTAISSISSLLGLDNIWTGLLNTFNNNVNVDGDFTANSSTGMINLSTSASNYGVGSILYPPTNTGSNNMVFGYGSLQNLDSGGNNVCFGDNNLNQITTGSFNVAIGSSAGANCQTSGNNNTYIGANTGQLVTNLTAYNNCTCIGYGCTATANNQITLGTSSNNVHMGGTVTGNVFQGFNPTGTIIQGLMNPTTATPTGYLYCNGASYSKTTYSSLFAILAYSYGYYYPTPTVSSTGSALINSTSITLSSTTGISVGMYINSPTKSVTFGAFILTINTTTKVITLGSGTVLIAMPLLSTLNFYSVAPLPLLPDFRGAFMRGADANGNAGYTGYVGSTNIGTPQKDQLISHTHLVDANMGTASANSCPILTIGATTFGYYTGVGTSVVVNSGTPSSGTPSVAIGVETRPFNFSVYHYIKY